MANRTDTIFHAGAMARARGQSLLDNPFSKMEAMPVATGESLEEWRWKFCRWQDGWNAENLARESQGICAAATV